MATKKIRIKQKVGLRKTRGVKVSKKSTKGKGKKSSKNNIVDIGTTRTRVIGSPGMGQNLNTTQELAKSMEKSRERARGATNNLALALGAALA